MLLRTCVACEVGSVSVLRFYVLSRSCCLAC